MGRSSITGGNPALPIPSGKDIRSLGPSDSCDSGSDVAPSSVQTSRSPTTTPPDR
jgi:hypothetical protein